MLIKFYGRFFMFIMYSTSRNIVEKKCNNLKSNKTLQETKNSSRFAYVIMVVLCPAV